MSENWVKYPRTPHLPTSPGSSADDIFTSVGDLMGRDVVLTEKLDGECTTMYTDGVHARSLDSRMHPSRAWVRGLHGTVAHEIPKDMRICGENTFARHSVGYDDLPTYFQVFNIWKGSTCLSWDDTLDWCELLGLTSVPVLYRGPMVPVAVLYQQWQERVDRVSEGFVVRDAGTFDLSDFGRKTGKWVRAGHVQTTQHWMHAELVPNRLA